MGRLFGVRVYMCMHTMFVTLTLTHIHSHSLTLTHTHSLTHSLTHTHSRLLAFKAAKAKASKKGATGAFSGSDGKPLFREFIGVPTGFFPAHWSDNEPSAEELHKYEEEEARLHEQRMDRIRALNNDDEL